MSKITPSKIKVLLRPEKPRDESGNNLLSRVIINEDIPHEIKLNLVRHILKSYPDQINEQDNEGNSPVHLLFKDVGTKVSEEDLSKTREFFDQLLYAGADLSLENKEGKFPSDLADERYYGYSLSEDQWIEALPNIYDHGLYNPDNQEDSKFRKVLDKYPVASDIIMKSRQARRQIEEKRGDIDNIARKKKFQLLDPEKFRNLDLGYGIKIELKTMLDKETSLWLKKTNTDSRSKLISFITDQDLDLSEKIVEDRKKNSPTIMPDSNPDNLEVKVKPAEEETTEKKQNSCSANH